MVWVVWEWGARSSTFWILLPSISIALNRDSSQIMWTAQILSWRRGGRDLSAFFENKTYISCRCRAFEKSRWAWAIGSWGACFKLKDLRVLRSPHSRQIVGYTATLSRGGRLFDWLLEWLEPISGYSKRVVMCYCDWLTPSRVLLLTQIIRLLYRADHHDRTNIPVENQSSVEFSDSDYITENSVRDGGFSRR